MIRDNAKQTGEILKRLLATDDKLLLDKTNFVDKLAKAGINGRDKSILDKALHLNILDILTAVEPASLESVQQGQSRLREILLGDNINNVRIDFVVNVFTLALGWITPEGAERQRIAAEQGQAGVEISPAMDDELITEAPRDEAADAGEAEEADTTQEAAKAEEIRQAPAIAPVEQIPVKSEAEYTAPTNSETAIPAGMMQQNNKAYQSLNSHDGSDKNNIDVRKKTELMVIGAVVCLLAIFVGLVYDSNTSKSVKTAVDNSSAKQSALQKQATPEEKVKVKRDRNNGAFLGNVAIGDDKDMVHKMLGNENRQESRNNQTIAYIYDDCTVVFDNRGLVIGLESNSKKVSTTLGVVEGSDLRVIQEEYGEPYAKSQYGDLTLYEYKVLAGNKRECILRFALNNNHVVDYISIRVAEVGEADEPNSPDTRSGKVIAAEAAQTLFQYHKNITNRDYRGAYSCTSDNWQNRVGYDGWAQGFKTTVSSEVSNVSYEYAAQDKVVLNYILTATDNPGGTRKFKGRAVLVKTGNGWKIETMEHKQGN